MASQNVTGMIATDWIRSAATNQRSAGAPACATWTPCAPPIQNRRVGSARTKSKSSIGVAASASSRLPSKKRARSRGPSSRSVLARGKNGAASSPSKESSFWPALAGIE